jgi:hypothetical protein
MTTRETTTRGTFERPTSITNEDEDRVKVKQLLLSIRERVENIEAWQREVKEMTKNGKKNA